jgi:WG containing repeat
MNWKDVKVSDDATYFLYVGNKIFNKNYIEVLKFHSPGIAPVKDETGAYHIDINGEELYKQRYSRVFGFYCDRASVISNESWFHIDEKGNKLYNKCFAWTGNFQENICTVRDLQNNYFHIDLNGNRCYKENYKYAGDFKDGIACVKGDDGFFRHVDHQGKFINNKIFMDLGVFHKNYATAKDEKGWFHIDKSGLPLYQERYELIEPFYNGFAVVTKKNNKKEIIDEAGKVILEL